MELCIERETASEWPVAGPEEARLDGGIGPAVKAREAPGDLGSWVCPSTVLAWIAHEVEMVAGNGCESGDRLKQPAGYRSKVMVTVLAYAYARQMFDSEAIARACRT